MGADRTVEAAVMGVHFVSGRRLGFRIGTGRRYSQVEVDRIIGANVSNATETINDAIGRQTFKIRSQVANGNGQVLYERKGARIDASGPFLEGHVTCLRRLTARMKAVFRVRAKGTTVIRIRIVTQRAKGVVTNALTVPYFLRYAYPSVLSA